MLDRRKVAGVLAELKDGAVVLGIGLNVNQTPAGAARRREGGRRLTCSVTGREYDRAAILADLLLEFRAPLRRLARRRAQGVALRGPGCPRLLRGRRVTVDGVAGTAQLIARDGRLEVDTGSGRVLLESGEVLFER